MTIITKWHKTECLITPDGSEDHMISSEGLSGHKVLPVLLETSSSAPQRPPVSCRKKWLCDVSWLSKRRKVKSFWDFRGTWHWW